jgi:hypothetical protein
MSTASGVDPLVAAKLGFPKLRYVFVELERRWSCTTLPKDLVQETVAITDLYVSGSNLRLREERSLSGGPPLVFPLIPEPKRLRGFPGRADLPLSTETRV